MKSEDTRNLFLAIALSVLYGRLAIFLPVLFLAEIRPRRRPIRRRPTSRPASELSRAPSPPHRQRPGLLTRTASATGAPDC
jgi:hypothetical protein